MTAQELDERINTLREKTYSVIADQDLVDMENIVRQKELDLRELQVELTLERELLINTGL